MSMKKTKPYLPARIASWICAVLLTTVLTGTVLCTAAVQALTSEENHIRIATDPQVIDGQMERIAGAVRDLAEEYGFSAEPVIRAVSRDEITELNTSMAGWWTKIVTEGIMDDEPSWTADALVPVMLETMDPEADSSDSYEKAVKAAEEIEKTVRAGAMPVRMPILSFGLRYLRRMADIPGAVRTASRLPVLGAAAGLLLAGLIALLTAAGIRVSLRYYGAAFGGAGIAAAFCMILARTAGIPEMISEASEGMSRQAGLAFREMALETGLYILILLAAGTACLVTYIRSGKCGNRRGGKHA